MSDLQLTFLGTASATPSPSRNVSGMALRLPCGAQYIIDCGEGTQHQALRSPVVKPSKVARIYVTHLHGDHSFGLPGLMCMISNAADEETAVPLDLVGPQGLAGYIRASLNYSCTRIGRKFRVIELMNVHEAELPPPPAPAAAPAAEAAAEEKKNEEDEGEGEGEAAAEPYHGVYALDAPEQPLHIDEVPGQQLLPDAQGVWRIEHPDPHEGAMTVCAVRLAHTVPSVGYVFQEAPKAGKVNMAHIKPILMANKAALAEQGVKNPMSLLSELTRSGRITLPDGAVLDASDPQVVGAERPGRKVAVCGDSSNSAAIYDVARDADLFVHEATNALTSLDQGKLTYAQVEATTIAHGHSTPQMAGAFARAAGARKLVLTHFSARYRGDASEESRAVMEEVRAGAVETFGSDVVLAVDLESVGVPRQP